MNKEEVDKFCKEYYGFTLEDADGSIGYWMGKYQELEQENTILKQNAEHNDKVVDWYRWKDNQLRSWLEEEKNRLARECSQIYEDSLGKTRLVNEDIFNEVNKILSKLNELEGGKND